MRIGNVQGIKIIFVGIIFLAIVVPLVLLYRELALFGSQAIYRYEVGENPPFIRTFYPRNPVSLVWEKGDYYGILKQSDVVYFDFRLPKTLRKFKEITVKVKFKNYIKGQDLLVGLKDHTKWPNLKKPIDSPTLNQLNWPPIREKNIVLFQKKKIFDSMGHFLRNPPRGAVVATYFFDNSLIRQEPVIIRNYKKSEDYLVIDHSLRGSHTLYTYVKDEPIDFIIEKQDLNRRKGQDVLTVNISRDNERIYTRTIPDDGITDNSRKVSSPQVISFQVANLKEGIYKIQLNSSKDILVRKISTKQHLLVFEKKLFLADNSEIYGVPATKPITIFIDAKGVNIKTSHEAGFQSILVNDIPTLRVAQTHISYHVNLVSGLNKITMQKGDLVLTSPYFYSFYKESFFKPRVVQIIEFDEDLSLDDIDFIVADYFPPRGEGVWRIGQQTFDLSNIEIMGDSLTFLIQAPGLKKKAGEIFIDSIEIILKKPSLF